MEVMNVLLVLVGALGDLAWRKFITEAKAVENNHSNVGILLVDVPWKDTDLQLEQELRLRIGQRLIEQRAEKINDDDLRRGVKFLKSNIENTPLPWEVDEFVSNHLDENQGNTNQVAEELTKQLNEWVSWFVEVSRTGFMRYLPDPVSAKQEASRLKEDGWKIALFVATPPDAYPKIVNQWSSLADRIVLEKPASGLNPTSLAYPGTSNLRKESSLIMQPAQITTTDHYNAKLITRALDRINDYHLFDYLLDPERIKRIRVELLEPAPLPLGRCNFYNGAGGAFGDMVPHLLQAVRALCKLTPENHRLVFGEKFYWARYENAPLDGAFSPPQGSPYSYSPGYYQPLNEQTETFVAFEAQIDIISASGQRRPIDLYCRTGKGFSPPRKSISVDTEYDPNGSELRLILDFDKATLSIRDDAKKFVLETGSLSLDEPFQSGIPWVGKESKEYRGTFEALVSSDWKADALDIRYFPPVSVAADLCDAVFERLVIERANRQQLLSYRRGDLTSYNEILSCLDDKAHW